MKKNLLAFTVVELLVVMGILATILSLSSVNLITFYNKNTLGTAVDVLISDMRQQQLQAMVGDSEGSGTNNAYGIYFQPTSYTLFKGTVYSSSDPLNFKVKLNDDLQFSNLMFRTHLGNSQVVFSSVSGETMDYDPNYNYVTLKNIQTSDTKTIQLNKYGTVVSVY